MDLDFAQMLNYNQLPPVYKSVGKLIRATATNKYMCICVNILQ